ncbi:unnamed protein product, partial [Mesorhabditis belari]|uniref:acid phosphatase n=1 Tax=Mesorhabditis belari TaxID=2138241 RepID=A0AAF3FG92_9BILA
MFLLVFLLFAASSAQSKQLVHVQTVFRHGARAPLYEFSSDVARQHYFRGFGQLSDLGLANGKHLGELFFHKYVATGFLDYRMRPDQVWFRSSPKERCLMTATEVARGMFPRNISVPILTYPTTEDDELLYPRVCDDQMAISEKTFGTKSWPEIFTKICRDTVNATLLGNYTRDYLEALKVEKYEGLRVPDWVRSSPGAEEIEQCFYEFMHNLCGVGRWKNVEVIKTKTGLLVNHLLSNASRAWRCHTNTSKEGDHCAHFQKFHAYSTHDSVVLPLAESLGILSALNNRLPEYTSGIIIELWDQNGSPYVKVYYRMSPRSHEVLDVSSQVRKCETDECPLAVFISCCDEYRLEKLSNVCSNAVKDGPKYGLLFWIFVALTLLLLIVVITLAALFKKERAKNSYRVLAKLIPGSDFIKTSTGKESVNATLEVAYVMCQAIKRWHELTGEKVGFKPAGGIKTTEEALEYVALIKEILGDEWLNPELFRIGASSLLDDCLKHL